MKRLIYTAVFEGYDRVYPPVHQEPDVDYVIVTDDQFLHVPGWNTYFVNKKSFATAKAANLYHRALLHRLLPDYDASLYVDGNVRILGSTVELFDEMERSGAAIMMFRHPKRSTVAEEVEAVVALGKVSSSEMLYKEFEDYKAKGFQDNIGLAETTIILKNHRHPQLDHSMELWWELFKKYLTRDQISLPYVIWKIRLQVAWLPGTFREHNSNFAICPHYKGKWSKSVLSVLCARSYDSILYKCMFYLWNYAIKIRSFFR